MLEAFALTKFFTCYAMQIFFVVLTTSDNIYQRKTGPCELTRK